jgi:hypothetical protein
MNIQYLIDIQGNTNSVVIPLNLWKEILSSLEKGIESTTLLNKIPPIPQEVAQNPLKELLNSNFIGCFEGDPNLSTNYKTEFGKILNEKYDHC